MQKPAWLLVPNSMVRAMLQSSGTVHSDDDRFYCWQQMNRVGSMVLQQVLKKTLPQFLDRIGKGESCIPSDAQTLSAYAVCVTDSLHRHWPGYYEWCGTTQVA